MSVIEVATQGPLSHLNWREGLPLLVSPRVVLRELRLLGRDPDRRSFADGDGFVPSEAVGAFLLKPLTEAVDDGDREGHDDLAPTLPAVEIAK